MKKVYVEGMLMICRIAYVGNYEVLYKIIQYNT